MPEQGETYAKFIEAELKAEYDRRASVDARALAIVTSSSGFLTLVFAITVLVTGKDYTFSAAGARGLVGSLAAFSVAAFVGLGANASLKYKVPEAATLLRMTSDHWTDSETAARNISAGLNVTTLATLRTGNNRKALAVLVAFGFQMAAILGLLLTLCWELRRVEACWVR